VACTFVVVGLGAGVLASTSPAVLKRSATEMTAHRLGGPVPTTSAPTTRSTTLPLRARSFSVPISVYAGASDAAGNQSDATLPTTISKALAIVPTTTSANLPLCQLSNFVASVTTDPSTYPQGEPVTILATVTNTGPACITDDDEGFVCIGADVKDASGVLVWTVWAPPSTGCPANSGPATVLAEGWSQHAVWTWEQDECTSHITNCSGQQVASGRFQLFGDNWDHLSAPVWITIESSSPGTTTTTS
jgi:hypothetical protein